MNPSRKQKIKKGDTKRTRWKTGLNKEATTQDATKKGKEAENNRRRNGAPMSEGGRYQKQRRVQNIHIHLCHPAVPNLPTGQATETRKSSIRSMGGADTGWGDRVVSQAMVNSQGTGELGAQNSFYVLSHSKSGPFVPSSRLQ